MSRYNEISLNLKFLRMTAFEIQYIPRTLGAYASFYETLAFNDGPSIRVIKLMDRIMLMSGRINNTRLIRREIHIFH